MSLNSGFKGLVHYEFMDEVENCVFRKSVINRAVS